MNQDVSHSTQNDVARICGESVKHVNMFLPLLRVSGIYIRYVYINSRLQDWKLLLPSLLLQETPPSTPVVTCQDITGPVSWCKIWAVKKANEFYNILLHVANQIATSYTLLLAEFTLEEECKLFSCLTSYLNLDIFRKDFHPPSKVKPFRR